MNLELYTDGGAFLDREFGAWAFVIPGIHSNYLSASRKKTIHLHRSGCLAQSTSNGAEIMAVALGLEFIADNIALLPPIESITIYCDCNRPVDAMNGLLEVWAANGWRTLSPAKQRTNATGKRGLSEKDKWVFLYAQVKRIEALSLPIETIKIQGHSGIEWNEKCDRLVKFELAKTATRKNRLAQAS